MISRTAPSEYEPEMRKRFTDQQIAEMYKHHALPIGWPSLEYEAFLERRRELIANVIREGYETLVSDDSATERPTIDVSSLVDAGESEAIEFKSTLRVNLHTRAPDSKMELSVLKTVAGFLNANGGTLVVGIADDGTSTGIDADQFESEDKMNLHFVNTVKSRLGTEALTNIHSHFEDFEDARVFVVQCQASRYPVFVIDGGVERFFVRTGPSTSELPPSQTQAFISRRFR